MSQLTQKKSSVQSSALELLDSGVVYRTGNPGYEYHFACHSHAVQVASGELLCAFQRGQALYSVDSVVDLSRSSDGGRTWTHQPFIRNVSGEGGTYSYHGPMLTRLADGTLLVNVLRFDRGDPEHPLFNEVTGGIVRSDTVLLRSTDDGKSWSKPLVISKPNGDYLTPSSPIIPLNHGRLYLPFDVWHAYEAPGPYQPRTIGLFSDDGGRTWTDPVAYADGSASGIGHWHAKTIRLNDGRLFGLFWSAEMPSGKARPLHRCIGSPDARQWSAPEPTNIPGQTNCPIELPDGRLVAIYTVRAQNPGFYVAFSNDGGLTWDLDRQLQVWDAAGRDKIGVHAPDSYPRSHDTIAYGAPMGTLLDNGDCFFNFWCTEMSVTQIRYARVRLH